VLVSSSSCQFRSFSIFKKLLRAQSTCFPKAPSVQNGVHSEEGAITPKEDPVTAATLSPTTEMHLDNQPNFLDPSWIAIYKYLGSEEGGDYKDYNFKRAPITLSNVPPDAEQPTGYYARKILWFHWRASIPPYTTAVVKERLETPFLALSIPTYWPISGQEVPRTTRKTKSPTRTIFTLFPKLTLELRMIIWKIHLEGNPGRIELAVANHSSRLEFRGNIPGNLRQGSRQIRKEALSKHGYVELKRTPEDTSGILFNPSVDMLYLSRSTGLLVYSFLAYHPDSLLKSLRESKALDTMKSIAIPVKQPRFYKFIETFRLYPSLELVFVVVGQELFMKDKDWVTNGRNLAGKLEGLKFDILETETLQRLGGWSQAHLWSKQGWEVRLQKLMARGEGEGKVTPRVEVVQAIRRR
jgi:hypothetical protein